MRQDCLPRLLFRKSRIKRNRRRLEVEPPDKRARFGRPMLAIHAGILPFNGERAVIADAIKRPDDLFEIDASPPERAEIPETILVTEVQMAAEDA